MKRGGDANLNNKSFHEYQVDSDGISGVLALLKACAKQKDIHRGGQMCNDIFKARLVERNIYVGNAVVHMYAKCGDLGKAREVFNQLPVPDVVSWTTLISGYTEQGRADIALLCFDNMQQEGICANETTLACILKSCGCTKSCLDGQRIHAKVAGEGLLKNSYIVANALVDMYAKCGFLGKAREVFEQLELRDVISWTALITGYSQHDQGEDAIDAFYHMQQEGICPNLVTYACILKAYGSIRDLGKGREIHAKIVNDVNLTEHNVLGNALLDMYGKCGLLGEAIKVFNDLKVQDVVSWTALIGGYAGCGHSEEAIGFFQTMQAKGITPNSVTFICVFKACCTSEAIQKAHEIHTKSITDRLLKNNYFVGNALVDMYAKCGMIEKAQEVFDQLPVLDCTAWNALIAGYAQHGHHDKAFNHFEKLQIKGFSPDIVTFLSILRLCAELGAAYKGHEVHIQVIKHGLCERHDVVLGSVLIDMYAGSGMLSEAQLVFDKIVTHDVASWTSLIRGYSHFGKHAIVFNNFNKMMQKSEEPDALTFTIILNACNHVGLLEMGLKYFESSINIGYGFIPDLDHYTCIVDLLSRAGHLDRAMAMIMNMPYFANIAIWHTILSACRNCGNVELARLAFDHAVQLNEKDVASYICMSSIYMAAGMNHNAEEIETMKLSKGLIYHFGSYYC